MKFCLNKRILFLLCFFSLSGFSQGTGLESKRIEIYSVAENIFSGIDTTSPTQANLLNVSDYATLLSGNLIEAFTKPFHSSRNDWIKVGKFTILATGLSFADKPIQKEGLKFSERKTFLKNTSAKISKISGTSGIIIGLAATGTLGLISKNKRLVTTTLLATQASVTGSAITTSIKYLAGRRRPSSFNPNEHAKPTFMGPFSRTSNGKTFHNAFPSGHTTVSFAIATVFASEYSDKPIVTVVAYSLASLVGISRIGENRHWATDVFAGAAIGYLSGKQAVKNYNQQSRKNAPGKVKNNVSFSLDYSFGYFQPGIIIDLN